MEKSEVNAIRTQVTHCHINNLDMCIFFRIFVGWEGGVACFEQVYASLTKCHELSEWVHRVGEYIYTMKHYIVF